MGVIDLDARVKKLEEGGADPGVIDQLEAAVTALEETVNGDGDTDLGLVGDVAALKATVNGDGETDFGLVGDVAALETATTPLDVTDKLTFNTALTIDESDTFVAAVKLGRLVTVNASVSISAGAGNLGAMTKLFDIDPTIAPAVPVQVYAEGASYSAQTAKAYPAPDYELGTTGGSRASFAMTWIIAEPEPEPEPTT